MAELSQSDAVLRTFRTQSHFTLSADRGWTQRFQLALTDVRDGVRLWRLSWTLGLSDIKLRYRGSALGPFWLTLSTAIMIASMGILYSYLFHVKTHDYLPYITVSIVFWNYLNTLITDGCNCFIQAESLIRGTRMPFTVHALRSVIRNTIVLAHNVIVIVGVFLIMRLPVSWEALWAVPALMLWLVDAYALSLFLGAFCARFRDVPQIVMALLQVVFFVTPIMWYAKVLEAHPKADLLIRFNPFYYMLDIIRAPLLGRPMPVDVVLKALIVSIVIFAITAFGFARTRGRIAYWV